MLEIKEYVDIKQYSTFNTGGVFRYFTIIKSIKDLISLYTMIESDGKYRGVPLFILGGGSNIIFSDGVINVLAIKSEIDSFEIIYETDTYVDIKVGSGFVWDDFVERVVNMGLYGVEAMSFIPGTVGAGPIQNVGAYGSEVKDVIQSVEVFEIKNGQIKSILNNDCKFGYRDSVFKNEAKNQYIITAVIYRLSKIDSSQEVLPSSFLKTLEYPGVKKYFDEQGIKNPTLKQIRQAIIEIRKEKLPNPKEIPNVGSFFKNTIVNKEIANKIIEKYPNAKFFPIDDTNTKVPAGWLIENAGLKGKSFGNVSVYDKNALVLINNGNATKEDIMKAKNEIIKIVQEKFGIVLEQEPEVV